MSQPSPVIANLPQLPPEEDFHRLRREGIGFIVQMGSRLWTEYNETDSGIAILEALCYAVTDLGYRSGWEIRDLLAPPLPSPDPAHPFPNQPFFTAREILTVNPWTPDDFRRLLIDQEAVRNAWIACKECACDTSYYAWCEGERLALSYQLPENRRLRPKEVWPLGLYEALLELEADADLGDLNDRKVEAAVTLEDANGKHPLTTELRFHDMALSDRVGWGLFLGSDDAFAGRNGQSFNLKLIGFGATRNYDLLTDPNLDDAGRNDYLRRHWRDLFYLALEIEMVPTGKKIVLHATLRFLGDAAARGAATVAALKGILEETGVNGLTQRYRKKELQKAAGVARAKESLFSHRNLDEEFCRVKLIGIEEVAACADVEVSPEVDIELVQARIWFEIEQYLNQAVPFYTLREMLEQGFPVEEIFNGPALKSGFIRTTDLEQATLRSVLCVSDLLNRLMEIDGVLAVNHLQLTKYDPEGKAVKGAADPAWTSDGKPIFDPGKISASWLLYLSPQHLPRLYRNASRFLFYKNGLPFLPRMDEALATLTQLRGEAERMRVKNAPNDLPIPAGNYRDPAAYFPVQYSFPLTYGIGVDQLPANANAKRRAQAKQFKGYLMVFEQLLADALEQLAHTADLFSLDPLVKRTYFAAHLSEALIQGYNELSTITQATLEALLEKEPEFLKRRNRFLDHVLARFGGEYREFTLLLEKLQGQQVALGALIGDKIDFITAYPVVSRDRAKAFNRELACAPGNDPAIKRRIALLLGKKELSDRIIVVEHLLLRPKFPGDALYPACSDGACRLCGEEDPYSFRLTLAMPGWMEPFDSDLVMREYADRVIRQELPSHLVGKICWVGNDGFEEDPCDPVILELTRLIEEKGNGIAGVRPTEDEACACALGAYHEFSQVFREWYQDKVLRHIHPDALKQQLELLFGQKVDRATIPCAAVWDDELWAEVTKLLVGRFLEIALYGFQFDRFQAAWCAWLEADAAFDWTEERLQERLQAILTENLLSSSADLGSPAGRICRCAERILRSYGATFDLWMQGLVASDSFDPDAPLPPFPLDPPPECAGLGFKAGTMARLKELVEDRYGAYRNVSYRLRVVLDLLGRLRNVYPPATLHDCDEGGDKNPVRLGTTALGN
uniref:Uncharacterized protein n=1 Tax=Geobacter sp. (strain M21) TaxID=443144 RepID=C6E5X2_GEOSM